VRRTGDIGLISISGESAVASGVRRIEALTGNHARKHANDTIALAKTAATELRTTLEDMPARIASLMEERKKLERDLSDARKKLAMGGGATNGSAAAANGVREVGPVRGSREIGGINFFSRTVSGVDLKDLRSIADEAKKLVGSGVVAIVGRSDDGKAGVVVGVTKDLTARFDAVELVRKGAEVLGGKGGGGRPDMAQAGGPDGSEADAALDAIEKAIKAIAGV
jgi:alanyl-tRNA synthetase